MAVNEFGTLRGCVLWQDYRRQTALDYGPAGNLHPATLYGDAALDAGAGLVLGGVNGYGGLALADDLNFAGAASFSIFYRGTPTDAVDGDTIVANSTGGTGTTVRFGLDIINGGSHHQRERVLIGDGTSYSAAYAADYTFSAGVELCGGVVVQSIGGGQTTVQHYVDGAASGGLTTLTRVLAASSKGLDIGRNYANNSFIWKGSFKWLLIFNRALSAAEAAYLATLGA